jgi:hypothetical protein
VNPFRTSDPVGQRIIGQSLEGVFRLLLKLGISEHLFNPEYPGDDVFSFVIYDDEHMLRPPTRWWWGRDKYKSLWKVP